MDSHFQMNFPQHFEKHSPDASAYTEPNNNSRMSRVMGKGALRSLSLSCQKEGLAGGHPIRESYRSTNVWQSHIITILRRGSSTSRNGHHDFP